MKRAGALVASFLLLGMVVFGFAQAQAQQYPPPPPTDEGTDNPACDLATCLRMTGEVGPTFRANQVEEGGDIRVVAIEGCCDAGARIDVYMESERVFLGSVTAAEDGSYFADLTLPASIKAGTHTLIADIEGCGILSRPISVLGTNVLGTSQTNDSDGGILPRTGAGILLLIMWALVLLGGGTVLVVSAWRYRARLVPAALRSGRSREKRAVLMLPAPEIPRIDTSRFVPHRSRRSDSPAERGWPYSDDVPGPAPDSTPS